MADTRLRDTAREFLKTDDAKARHLAERLRSGALSVEMAELAAYCGDITAANVLGLERVTALSCYGGIRDGAVYIPSILEAWLATLWHWRALAIRLAWCASVKEFIQKAHADCESCERTLPGVVEAVKSGSRLAILQSEMLCLVAFSLNAAADLESIPDNVASCSTVMMPLDALSMSEDELGKYENAARMRSAILAPMAYGFCTEDELRHTITSTLTSWALS